MKIYNYRKKKYRKTTKLFGITIFEQIFNHMTTKRYQYFLHGLVTTYKVKDIYDFHVEKEIKIAGKSILKRVEDGNCCYWYCGSKLIRKISAIEAFKKRYIRYFDRKYDDIYILNANSGEIFLFLTYILNILIKKNKSTAPLLVATKEYHLQIINAICPDIPSIYVKSADINVKEDAFFLEGHRFFQIFQHKYFVEVETNIKNNPVGKVHYFNSMLKHFALSKDELELNKISISPEIEKSMLKKIEALNLNLSNFVFLSPEARSCTLIDNLFWKRLISEFKNYGFDVFVNLADYCVDLKGIPYKTCNLSYPEAFALAKLSKKIVSLRSGLTEFLLQSGVPMDVLYTCFRNRRFFNDMTVQQVMSGFGLNELPDITTYKVREYMYDDDTSNSLIDRIVKSTVESVEYA